LIRDMASQAGVRRASATFRFVPRTPIGDRQPEMLLPVRPVYASYPGPVSLTQSCDSLLIGVTDTLSLIFDP